MCMLKVQKIWSVDCICCWSCVTQEAAWMLLIYHPTEVQEPPEACYSQLMHSLNLPLHFYSPSHALPCCILPSLSFLSSPLFSMSYCTLHFFPLSLSLSQALTTLLHRALFLPLALHTRAHALTHWHTETVAATTTASNLPHTPVRQCASASGLPWPTSWYSPKYAYS